MGRRMILIFEYNWGSEQCYGTSIFPVEYSSKDDLLLDFEIACIEAHENNKDFNFFGDYYLLDLSDFIYYDYQIGRKKFQYVSPEVYTLEEWLERFTLKVKNTKE